MDKFKQCSVDALQKRATRQDMKQLGRLRLLSRTSQSRGSTHCATKSQDLIAAGPLYCYLKVMVCSPRKILMYPMKAALQNQICLNSVMPRRMQHGMSGLCPTAFKPFRTSRRKRSAQCSALIIELSRLLKPHSVEDPSPVSELMDT